MTINELQKRLDLISNKIIVYFDENQELSSIDWLGKFDNFILYDAKKDVFNDGVCRGLLDLDNFLFEHRGGLEYEEKRLLRVQRTIMYSYSTVLGERITVLKEEIRKDYEN